MNRLSTSNQSGNQRNYFGDIQTRVNGWLHWSQPALLNPPASRPASSTRFDFTVSRGEWERGTEEGFLFHRTRAGVCRCGLGFACRALGVADEQLDHVRQVDALVSHHVIEPHVLGPLQFLIDLKHGQGASQTPGQAALQDSAHQTMDAIRIMALNDRKVGKHYEDESDRYLYDLPVIRSEAHREKLLIAEFSKHNIGITFID